MRLDQKIMALAMTGLLTLSGCAFDGEIVKKAYEPEKSWIEICPLVLCDKERVVRGKVPVCCIDDEDFMIYVRKRGTNSERVFYLKDGENFNQLEVGDEFTYDGKVADEKDSIEKRRLPESEFEELVK